MGGFNTAPRDFRGDVSVDGDLSVGGETDTNQVVTTLGLSFGTRPVFSGPSKKQIPFDTTNIAQLSSVTADTANSKLIINESGNYEITAGVQISRTDALGSKLFLNIQLNGSNIESRSEEYTIEFQRLAVATRTVNLSASDEITAEIQLSSISSSDSYEIPNNNTFLQIVKI
jgi:hypothetical protein